MKSKIGRPSQYSIEIILEICCQIAEGKPLTLVCKPSKMPSLSTVFKWLSENEEFSDMYAQAHEMQAEVLASQITELADEKPRTYLDNNGAEKIDSAWVNNQRNRIDARKWTASKLKPRKYGDAVTFEHSKEFDIKKLTDTQLDEKISLLMERGGFNLIPTHQTSS